MEQIVSESYCLSQEGDEWGQSGNETSKVGCQEKAVVIVVAKYQEKAKGRMATSPGPVV